MEKKELENKHSEKLILNHSEQRKVTLAIIIGGEKKDPARYQLIVDGHLE